MEITAAPTVIPGMGKRIKSKDSLQITKVPTYPTRIPKIPPMPQIMAASMRNCKIMLRRSAPIALRIPISRIRFVTVTSMIFIMPIPPTSREIAAMPSRNLFCVLLSVCPQSGAVKSYRTPHFEKNIPLMQQSLYCIRGTEKFKIFF